APVVLADRVAAAQLQGAGRGGPRRDRGDVRRGTGRRTRLDAGAHRHRGTPLPRQAGARSRSPQVAWPGPDQCRRPRGRHAAGALVAWRKEAAGKHVALDADELLVLETLADYAAVALETTRLFDQALRGRAAAEERQARVQAIMDSVADGIVTFDEHGRIESSNPAAERIFGYAADEIREQPVATLLPDLAPSEAAGSAGFHREVLGRRQQGGVVPIDLVVSELKLDDPHLSIAVVRAITERKAF